MNKIYLIQFDNGESWEDRHVSDICACLNKIQAESLVKELSDWIEKARSEMPACYYDSPEYKDGVLTDEQMERHEAEQRKWFDSLCPPYGFNQVRSAISEFGQHSGWVSMKEVDLFEKL